MKVQTEKKESAKEDMGESFKSFDDSLNDRGTEHLYSLEELTNESDVKSHEKNQKHLLGSEFRTESSKKEPYESASASKLSKSISNDAKMKTKNDYPKISFSSSHHQNQKKKDHVYPQGKRGSMTEVADGLYSYEQEEGFSKNKVGQKSTNSDKI